MIATTYDDRDDDDDDDDDRVIYMDNITLSYMHTHKTTTTQTIKTSTTIALIGRLPYRRAINASVAKRALIVDTDRSRSDRRQTCVTMVLHVICQPTFQIKIEIEAAI